MYFETVSLTEPKVHLFSRAGRPVSFRDPPVLCRPAPPSGTRGCRCTQLWLALYVGSGNLISRPHASGGRHLIDPSISLALLCFSNLPFPNLLRKHQCHCPVQSETDMVCNRTEIKHKAQGGGGDSPDFRYAVSEMSLLRFLY